MEKQKQSFPETQPPENAMPDREKIANPFENRQPADKDIEEAKEKLENEQAFKEAQTERD